MRNEAMFVKKDALNVFTRHLRNLISASPDLCISGQMVRVQLRNGSGTWVRFDEHEQTFHTPNWTHAWRLDGSSCAAPELDIVGLRGPDDRCGFPL